MIRITVGLISVALLGAAVKNPISPPQVSNFPENAFGSQMVAGDIDGDRDTDLIVWENNGIDPYLLVNDSRGHFLFNTGKPFGSLTGTNIFFKILLEDVDCDGDLDAFILSSRTGSSTPQADHLFLNNGTGKFRERSKNRLPHRKTVGIDAIFFDADNDGDRDLFISCGSAVPTVNAQDLLYLNDGKGRFIDATDSLVPPNLDSSFGAAAGDIDGDRDFDLVITRRFGPAKVLVWRDGRYHDESNSRFPQIPLNAHDHALLVDVDGDADLDFLVGTVAFGGSDWNERDRLFINNGEGCFIDATDIMMPDIRTSVGAGTKAVADLDRDGLPEIFLPNSAGRSVLYSAFNGPIDPGEILIGQETKFQIDDRIHFFMPGADSDLAGALFFDADGDGDLDVIGSHRNKIPLRFWRR